MLTAWRNRIVEDPETWLDLVKPYADPKGKIFMRTLSALTRLPRGFQDQRGSALEPWLLWKSFLMGRSVSDAEAQSRRLVDIVREVARAAAPLLKYGWALADLPVEKDPRRHAAVSTHGVVAAGTQGGFHAGTGLAGSADFQQHLAADGQPQTLVGKERAGGQQVQARHDQVAPQLLGADFAPAAQRGNDRQMLRLDQRDLALAAFGPGLRGAVALQPAAGHCDDFGHPAHRRPSRRPQPDRLQPPVLREPARELAQPALGIHDDGSSGNSAAIKARAWRPATSSM